MSESAAELLDASRSPSMLSVKSGVRRVNNGPIYVVGAGVLLFLAAFAVVFLYLVSVAIMAGLATKLYLALMGRVQGDEGQPGVRGMKAWLRPFHVIVGVVMVLTAYFAMRWPLPAGALLAAVLLLAYPLFVTLTRKGESAPETNTTDTVAEERERVLRLVEAGKINAEEAAELITALGQSHVRAAAAAPATPFGREEAFRLVGAGLVLVGFFLPWFNVNLGQELQRAMAGVAGAMPGGMPFPNMPAVSTATSTMSGGDLRFGLGWLVLAAALVVAVLPLLWPARAAARPAQRAVSLVAAGVGSLILLYLLSENLRYATFGILFVVAGYAVLWTALVREYFARFHAPRLAVV